MELYTGYFALVDKYEKLECTCVSISYACPVFYKRTKRLQFPTLAPEESLLLKFKNKEISFQQYAVEYYAMLNTLDAANILDTIRNLTFDAPNVVLLCWEKNYAQCHRSLVSKWFYTNLKIEIPEFSEEKFRQRRLALLKHPKKKYRAI